MNSLGSYVICTRVSPNRLCSSPLRSERCSRALFAGDAAPTPGPRPVNQHLTLKSAKLRSAHQRCCQRRALFISVQAALTLWSLNSTSLSPVEWSPPPRHLCQRGRQRGLASQGARTRRRSRKEPLAEVDSTPFWKQLRGPPHSGWHCHPADCAQSHPPRGSGVQLQVRT